MAISETQHKNPRVDGQQVIPRTLVNLPSPGVSEAYRVYNTLGDVSRRENCPLHMKQVRPDFQLKLGLSMMKAIATTGIRENDTPREEANNIILG